MSALLDSLQRAGAPADPSVLRRLWRRLPMQVRLQLFFHFTRLIAPLPDRSARGGFPLAVAGMFFAFAGAAIETALACAYNMAQFFGWPWGKFRGPRHAPRFTLGWLVVLAVSTLIILTGVDPVQVVEYSIVFSVVILPLTYFPLLLVASDGRVMGAHRNGIVANVLGWAYLALVTLAALAAIPLLVLTHGGQG